MLMENNIMLAETGDFGFKHPMKTNSSPSQKVTNLLFPALRLCLEYISGLSV